MTGISATIWTGTGFSATLRNSILSAKANSHYYDDEANALAPSQKAF